MFCINFILNLGICFVFIFYGIYILLPPDIALLIRFTKNMYNYTSKILCLLHTLTLDTSKDDKIVPTTQNNFRYITK